MKGLLNDIFTKYGIKKIRSLKENAVMECIDGNMHIDGFEVILSKKGLSDGYDCLICSDDYTSFNDCKIEIVE